MKLRRREINVFSMSALDLFASGMGAFILLAVMALPFFPNTGDSEERIEDIKDQLAEVREQRDNARDRASGLEQVLAKIQRDTDVQQVLQEALNDALRQIEDTQREVRDLEEALAKAKELQPDEGSNDAQQALEEALEEAQRQRENAENRALGLENALANAKMPDIDIVICLDVTASMTGQIEGLKREIAVLAGILDRLTPSAGIGIVAFGDRTWMQPIHVQEIVPTSNLRQLESFVQILTPNMDPYALRNQDGPEALATALERGIALNWRAASERRYVIVVTDNAAYPERETAALQMARGFAAMEGQYVATVRANFVPFFSDRQAADRFLPQLAMAGNGQFVDAAGGESMVGSLLLAILGV